MAWFEILPQSCPPECAIAPSRVILYRILEAETPTNNDFLSQRMLYPNKKFHVDECQARAISVFSDIDSCKAVMKFPKYKNKNCRVGQLFLKEQDGVIANTPSKISKNHFSWWRSTNFDISSVEVTNE